MIDFALPLRSNISKTVKKENYFKLPNNKKTKIGNHHGIHFEKMFPIKNEYKIKFRKDEFLEKIIVPFIILHFKELVIQAQEYLNRYEAGIRTNYSTNIEEILKKLKIEIE